MDEICGLDMAVGMNTFNKGYRTTQPTHIT